MSDPHRSGSISPSADLVVVGLGPAGRALCHRAASAGLDVVGIDPHPTRRWTPTYSAWVDELPRWLPAGVIGSVTDKPAVWTTRQQIIDRTYCVLDTAALQDALSVNSGRVIKASAVPVSPTLVRLADGTIVRGRHVVDARGTMGQAGLAEQTAFGVVVDRAVGEPILEGTGAWFMDWRRDNGTASTDVPSFLYAVVLDDRRILLEETCLVGRPPLALKVLQNRLRTRLQGRGCILSGEEPIERVRFPVQPPPPDDSERGIIRFGARSTMMHPATGYSVAASMGAADTVVESLGHKKRIGTPSIWAVQRLRNLGLRTALNLGPELVPHFFASFFDLPVSSQRAYLSGRSDAVGTIRAMAKMFPTLPTSARIAIARTVVGS